MTRIICLANSLKRSERCIAGIEPATGRWIRPVTAHLDGRVPRPTRLVAGAEPRLLDLLEIPLADTGPDYGFESENRLILPGAWRRVGRARASDLLNTARPTARSSTRPRRTSRCPTCRPCRPRSAARSSSSRPRTSRYGGTGHRIAGRGRWSLPRGNG